MDRLGMVFAQGQGETLGWERHAALAANRSFLAMPELAKAIERLSGI